ncbi:MAG: hypothetical protein KGJ87_09175 [Planctomycetota bacterium]|nr:hypothetical protein [Planctomycetota bacterium]
MAKKDPTAIELLIAGVVFLIAGIYESSIPYIGIIIAIGAVLLIVGAIKLYMELK